MTLASTEEPRDERYLVPGLARGLQVLGCFSRQDRELTGAELSRRLALPRASVFRLLHTLEQMGFVERVADSPAYKLSLGVLRLGFEFLASMELTEHGRPIREELRTQSGFSAHLVVRDGREVVFVIKAAGANAQFHSIQVGARLPAHATVLGRALLSGLDMAELRRLYPEEPLPAYTAKTPTTLAALKQLMDADRALGYGLSQGGYEAGITTIAAPVLNDQRRVVAAVSITVPAQQLADDQAAPLAAMVRQAAEQLSQRLSQLMPAGARPTTSL
jgi:DNA-binding IclR family transcriptional regulator